MFKIYLKGSNKYIYEFILLFLSCQSARLCFNREGVSLVYSPAIVLMFVRVVDETNQWSVTSSL